MTQLASSLDDFVLGNGNGLACLAGMPVLVSPLKARRMTSVTRVNPDMAASKSQVGSQLAFERVEQKDTAVARAESCQMAQCLDEGAHKFSGVVLAGLTVDCSYVSAKDQLSLGLCTNSSCGQQAYAMWLPPQDCSVVVSNKALAVWGVGLLRVISGHLIWGCSLAVLFLNPTNCNAGTKTAMQDKQLQCSFSCILQYGAL